MHALFPEKEYISRIFVAVWIWVLTLHTQSIPVTKRFSGKLRETTLYKKCEPDILARKNWDVQFQGLNYCSFVWRRKRERIAIDFPSPAILDTCPHTQVESCAGI
jgi:hypothetical protein